MRRRPSIYSSFLCRFPLGFHVSFGIHAIPMRNVFRPSKVSTAGAAIHKKHRTFSISTDSLDDFLMN